MRTDLNKKAAYALAAVIVAAALYATSLKNYLFFHSMAELFSILIAAGIFVIAWNTRKFMPNAFLLFIGVAYLYIAFIDLMHTLAYKGMGMFPGADANLPTQLWIAGRYMEAVSLCAAPLFLGKKLRVVPVAVAYFFATAFLLFSIHSRVFPDAFIEGRGLTPFKVASEYIISLILAAAIIYLLKKSEYFEKPVLNLLIGSMVTTIASEMAFTLYEDVYGFFNLLGHYLKIASFYLIYAALIKTNLVKPYEFLAHEIDQRKQAEEESRESEERYRLVQENSMDAILLTAPDGSILSANQAACEMFQRTEEEICRIGRNGLVDIDDPCLPVLLEERMRTGKATGELTMLRKNGSKFPVELSSSVFVASSGQNRTSMIIRDITGCKQAKEELVKYRDHLEDLVKERTKELKEAQEALVNLVEDLNEKSVQLARATDQAQSADRLKSAFLATMSHELRTPLNSIIGFTGIVLQGMSGPLNDEQAKQLGMVKGSANHLLELINDVLDISKIEAGQVQIIRKSFDMRSVIEVVLRAVMPLAAKKGLSVDSALASDVGLIISDQRRVKQILINLVNNAVKFTERGAVRIECRINEGRLETCVRDTGIGIKPEDMGKLFMPFRQIDTGLARNHEGTGLGLSICGKLVEMLGGTIRVESEWGKGSAFTFTLPLS